MAVVKKILQYDDITYNTNFDKRQIIFKFLRLYNL